MDTYTNKTKDIRHRVAANGASRESNSAVIPQDNRQSTIAQRKLQEMANNSHHVKQLQVIQTMASAPGKQPIQKVEFPKHRLNQDIKAPTQEEYDAHDKKWNYGDGGSGQETLERNNMRNRAEYARALDALSAHKEWYKPEGGEAVQFSKLGDYYNAALTFYKGTREAGHTIWIGVQQDLRQLIQTAFFQGYAVNAPKVQELILNAALAKTLMESDGLGSAGRADMRR